MATPDRAAPHRLDLAECLIGLGLDHVARHELVDVARRGPGAPEFAEAAQLLVTVWERSGLTTDLIALVGEVPRDALAGRDRSSFHIARALALYDEGNLSETVRHSQSISARSPAYLDAQVLEARIRAERCMPGSKSAMVGFRNVVEADLSTVPAGLVPAYADLQQLAQMQVARGWYAMERYEHAASQYAEVDEASIYAAQALLERAWSTVAAGDPDSADRLLSDLADRPEGDGFRAESTLIGAWAHVRRCDPDAAKRLLTEFGDAHGAERAALRAFLDRHDPDRADEAWAEWFAPANGDGGDSVTAKWLRTPELAPLRASLLTIEGEVAVLESGRRGWAGALAPYALEILDEERTSYELAAGRALLDEVAWELALRDRLADPAGSVDPPTASWRYTMFDLLDQPLDTARQPCPAR